MKRLYATVFICVLMASFIISFNKLHAEETYPVRPISFVIPMEAGADPDILLRPWAEKVSKILGQPIVIVNKPGGPQTIGYREVHGAKPDGYTMLDDCLSFSFYIIYGVNKYFSFFISH